MKIDLLVDVACVLPGIQQVMGLAGLVYNLAKRINDAIIMRGLQKNIPAAKLSNLDAQRNHHINSENNNRDIKNHNNGIFRNFIRMIPIIGSGYSLYRIVDHIRFPDTII